MRHGHCVGGKTTITWNSWHCMVRRCLDAFRSDHQYYYGQGIEVCDRWNPLKTRDAFSNFLEDMGERPSSAHTLGRKRSGGGYSKDNCAWQTRNEQNAELTYRGHDLLTVGGVTATKREWSEIAEVTYKSFLQRLRRGWTIEEACSIKAKSRRKKCVA